MALEEAYFKAEEKDLARLAEIQSLAEEIMDVSAWKACSDLCRSLTRPNRLQDCVTTRLSDADPVLFLAFQVGDRTLFASSAQQY